MLAQPTEHCQLFIDFEREAFGRISPSPAILTMYDPDSRTLARTRLATYGSTRFTMTKERKKARLVEAALNPHQRRRVEETLEANQTELGYSNAYVENIMTAAQSKIKRFLCVAQIFFHRPEPGRES